MEDNEINTAIHDEIDGGSSVIRDYCNELDAMHEAENEINTVQQMAYVSALTNIREGMGLNLFTHLVHATSRQRAESFLRVKGLWKESRPTHSLPA